MKESVKLFIEEVDKEHLLITEVASWDDPHKKYLDKGTVSCDEAERYERVPIKNAVKKLYPGFFKDSEIDSAIQNCCQSTEQAREREEFFSFLIIFLGLFYKLCSNPPPKSSKLL